MSVGARLATAAAILALGGAAHATDEQTLKHLQAPPPAEVKAIDATAKPRAVKFARIVVQLPPEPWAFVRIAGHLDGRVVVYARDQLLTWNDGERDIKLSTVSTVFDEEMRAAGIPTDASADSLFAQDSTADLQVGARVTRMEANFCRYCGFFDNLDGRWTGAVVMSTHWEIYSTLERKVVATVDTQGGYNTPKKGIDGSPDQIINNAFRDNVRRLVASDEFRRIVTSRPGASLLDLASASPTIDLPPAKSHPSLRSAPAAVATVFANDGSGSGFLVSSGMLLTNRHVVGASKYVKLKWADGSETLGEVVREDARRDVALVKIDPVNRPALALRLAPAEQGEAVYAIGSPLGEEQHDSMTKGIVSALRVRDGLSYIQSDVAVTHGNSGGPLLDDHGAVIGMTVSGLEPEGAPVGINFFIPIGDALKALNLKPAG